MRSTILARVVLDVDYRDGRNVCFDGRASSSRCPRPTIHILLNTIIIFIYTLVFYI